MDIVVLYRGLTNELVTLLKFCLHEQSTGLPLYWTFERPRKGKLVRVSSPALCVRHDGEGDLPERPGQGGPALLRHAPPRHRGRRPREGGAGAGRQTHRRHAGARCSRLAHVCNLHCSHLTLKVDPGRELDEGEVVVCGGGVVVRVLDNPRHGRAGTLGHRVAAQVDLRKMNGSHL